MQKRIFRLDKGFIMSKFYRVDFFPGAINEGEGKMSIHRRSAEARIVLERTDLAGLLQGIEVGTGKSRHLLRRTAKGAPRLVGPVDHGNINVRSNIGIDPESQQVVSGARALTSGHLDIPALSDFCCSRMRGVNITQAVSSSALFIG